MIDALGVTLFALLLPMYSWAGLAGLMAAAGPILLGYGTVLIVPIAFLVQINAGRGKFLWHRAGELASVGVILHGAAFLLLVATGGKMGSLDVTASWVLFAAVLTLGTAFLALIGFAAGWFVTLLFDR